MLEDFRALKAAIARDPLTFPRRILGRTYWSKQGELYRATHTHDRVVGYGGQSVGKTKAFADRVAEIAAMDLAKVVLVGPKFEQVEANLWSAVKEAFADAQERGAPIGGKLMATEWRGPRPGSWVKVAGANKEESLRFGHGERFTVVLDEATDFPAWAWSAVEGMLASEGSRLFISFNPAADANDHTRKIAASSRYSAHRLSCLDHPNVVSGENIYRGAVTRKWVDDFRIDLAEGRRVKWQWDALVEGKFPDGAIDALLSLAELEASLSVEADDVPRLGVDVARSWDRDRNVIVLVDEKRRARVVAAFHCKDLTFVAGKVMEAIRTYGVEPSMCSVDAGGPGGGVIDMCRNAGFHVTAVDFGGAATGAWAHLIGRETLCKNRRAEMYWTLARSCNSLAVSIPRDFWPDLDLIRVGYKANEIFIVDKEAIRAECGRSPDMADALALAFAVPTSVGPLVSFASSPWDSED